MGIHGLTHQLAIQCDIAIELHQEGQGVIGGVFILFLDRLAGGNGNNTLFGQSVETTWSVTGQRSGSVSLTGGEYLIAFEGIGLLQGGSAADMFNLGYNINANGVEPCHPCHRQEDPPMWRHFDDQTVNARGRAVAAQHDNNVADAPELVAVWIKYRRSCQTPHERTHPEDIPMQ